MFHDRARLTVIAGRGGDGSLHFRREKFVPKGGPDGGDGGDGGDIVLVARADLRDLSRFRTASHFRAQRGVHGQGSGKHGKRSENGGEEVGNTHEEKCFVTAVDRIGHGHLTGMKKHTVNAPRKDGKERIEKPGISDVRTHKGRSVTTYAY